jgi:hypothetical protein
MPLHYFARDAPPGDTKGKDQSSFAVIVLWRLGKDLRRLRIDGDGAPGFMILLGGHLRRDMKQSPWECDLYHSRFPFACLTLLGTS